MFWSLLGVLATLALPLIGFTQDSPRQLLDETVKEQARIDAESASSQLRISQLADKTADLLGQYDAALEIFEEASGLDSVAGRNAAAWIDYVRDRRQFAVNQR